MALNLVNGKNQMIRKFFHMFCVGMMVLTASVVCAADNGAGQIQTQKFVLDNGLTVLISEMPASSTVSVFGLVKTGSATEGKYTGTGISHFLEHMLFKGTDKRGVGAISKEVQALGGTINASTSFDYTIYTLTVPQTAFDQGLDIISDMLMHSKFDEVELNREREVVYGEMQLYWDNPSRYLSQLVFDTVYKQHPYGIPVIGYEELLRSLKRDDFVDYYQTHYAPNNIVISIAGNVRRDDVLPKVREIFKDFARKPTILRNLAAEPTQINMRTRTEQYATDLTRVSMDYAGVSLRDSDLFAMDVLAMIIGQGESSRLYKEIFLNKKLVRSISASNFTPMDRGVFEIEMLLEQAHVDAAVAAVKQQIALIVKNGVLPDELDKVKRQIFSQHIFDRLTSDAVANDAAAYEAFIGDYDFSKKYVEAVKKVSVEDIKRVAKHYFRDDKLSLVVLKPKVESTSAFETTSVQKSLEIQKVVLDNGLTILLRENHAVPVVSMNLVMNGGTGQETAENNGVSQLTAQLLTAGTKTRSAQQIAQSVESRGASFGPFSGRNSFGLTFNGLAQDTNFAVALLADTIKNPIFPEDELLREKLNMRTALIGEDDNIRAVSARHLRESLFLTHPFRLNGLGTMATIEKLSRSDVMEFYQHYVVPNNMVLSVFGDFDRAQMMKMINKQFAGLKNKDVKVLTYAESPPKQTREEIIRLDKKQAMVMLGFQGVDMKSRDRFVSEVLGALLGSSFSGRIFTTIREEFGQAYTLGGGYSSGRDMGMLAFFVQTTDANVSKVKDLLIQLIADIRDKPVGEAELKDMKAYLKGSFQMGLQTDSSLGFMCALDELYGNGYDYYQRYEQQIDAVTPEDIERVALEYLDLNKAALVVARPTDEILKNSKGEDPVVVPTFSPDIH
jgi:zinc protease